MGGVWAWLLKSNVKVAAWAESAATTAPVEIATAAIATVQVFLDIKFIGVPTNVYFSGVSNETHNGYEVDEKIVVLVAR